MTLAEESTILQCRSEGFTEYGRLGFTEWKLEGLPYVHVNQAPPYWRALTNRGIRRWG